LKRPELIPHKILTAHQAVQQVAQWRLLSKTIAFTNGVFDLLHQRHIYSLSAAAAEADRLIVGLNSDASVKRLKGPERPVNNQDSRALLLASLAIVDIVVIFEEDTPAELIRSLLPDVLVKGGDYTVDQVAGAADVIAAGGRVVINPILEGFSTTSIIEQLKK
jgi:D-beta-D-heptose 7-phosphate kinase/D-beta-D-heptose 1-phosphate adenosyltransferase